MQQVLEYVGPCVVEGFNYCMATASDTLFHDGVTHFLSCFGLILHLLFFNSNNALVLFLVLFCSYFFFNSNNALNSQYQS
jgi:hypothetical protein